LTGAPLFSIARKRSFRWYLVSTSSGDDTGFLGADTGMMLPPGSLVARARTNLSTPVTSAVVDENETGLGEPAADEVDQELDRISGWISGGFKNWTDADRRLLLITVLGGLAVNVLTVLVLALAILRARATNNATVTGVLAIATNVIALTFAAFFTISRPVGFALLLLGLILIILVLALAGKAIGIK
jgi:hypothetical protein